MPESDLFAFYGSLRIGMSNYDQYASSMSYQRATRISGYRMYSLGDYPYIVKSENHGDKIVVEIFKSDNEDIKMKIHKLEIDAGYFYEIINLDGDDVGIYLFEQPGNDPWVKSGNWVQFFRQGNK
ncbi:MAG: gamma-glutamylcyclotransferase family protein [Cyclobacteriaceae bacterium]|nr:gamma-glutamylcyclotransferase [Cyclobacteriaceae bacterium]